MTLPAKVWGGILRPMSGEPRTQQKPSSSPPFDGDDVRQAAQWLADSDLPADGALSRAQLIALRQSAQRHYVTQPGITMASMSRQAPWSRVHPSTLREWAAADRWRKKRKLFWNRVARLVEQRLAREYAERLVEWRLRVAPGVPGHGDDKRAAHSEPKCD